MLGYYGLRCPIGQKGETRTVNTRDRWALQTWESIEALRGVVLFEEVLDALREKAAEAIELAFYSSRAHSESWVPVLPIVPRDLLRIDTNEILSGHNIEDVLPTPRVPYFLVDVDVGRSSVGLDAHRALLAIQMLRRYPLTFEQALFLFSREGKMCPEQIFVLGSIDVDRPKTPVVLRVPEEELPRSIPLSSLQFGAPSFAAII